MLGKLLSAAAAMALMVSAAAAADLQFADIGRVVSWRPGGPRLIYIKDANEQWYKVEILEPCMDLYPGKDPTFVTLTDPNGQRYGGVVIEHHQCSVTSLTKMTEPPPREPYVPKPAKTAAKPAAKPAAPAKK